MAIKAINVLPYNDASVASACVDEDGKPKEFKIEGVPGLTLIVAKSGTGTFYCRYQVGKGDDKKYRREKIGRRGLLKLKDAKAKATSLMTEVALGVDPVARNEADAKAAVESAKAKANALTLKQLFDLRVAAAGSEPGRTLEDYDQVLKKHVYTKLGDVPANDITPEMLVEVLEAVEAKSKNAAHKARSALGSTFKWGLQRRKVKANPVQGLGFIHKSERRKINVSDDELKTIWQGFESPELTASQPMRLIMKLALLTGQRNGEVAGAEKSELKLDGPDPRWTIPARRMKRKDEEQLVPLSSQAVMLFKRAVELSDHETFVFPGAMTGRPGPTARHRSHIGQESVSRAMDRVRKVADIENVHLHDMRKVLTTWLGERLEHPAVLDRILHHARAGVTGTHYDFSVLKGPMRKALQDWADHVWNVVGAGGGAHNVRKLKQA